MNMFIYPCSVRPTMFIIKNIYSQPHCAATVPHSSERTTAMQSFLHSRPDGGLAASLLCRALTLYPILKYVPAGVRTEVCRAFQEAIPLRPMQPIISAHLIR